MNDTETREEIRIIETALKEIYYFRDANVRLHDENPATVEGQFDLPDLIPTIGFELADWELHHVMRQFVIDIRNQFGGLMTIAELWGLPLHVVLTHGEVKSHGRYWTRTSIDFNARNVTDDEQRIEKIHDLVRDCEWVIDMWFDRELGPVIARLVRDNGESEQ